jgi:hypothetical protein
MDNAVEKDAHKASSRFKSSFMSTSIVSGNETVNVSVHGSKGSSLMASRMRSSATYALALR